MKYWVALLFFIILNSTIGVFMKFTSSSPPPLTMNFLRLFFAFIVVLVVVPRFDSGAFKMKAGDLRLYALIGILFAITATAHASAYFFAPIPNVILLSSASVLVVFLMSALFIAEKATKLTMAAGLLALAGIAIINPLQGGASVVGNVLALVSAITGGLMVVTMRYADTTHSLGDIMWILLFATLFMFPLALMEGFQNVTAGMLWIFLSGAVSLGVAYVFFTYALQRIEASLASVAVLVGSALFSILLGIIFVGEVITSSITLGGSMIVASGILLEYRAFMVRV